MRRVDLQRMIVEGTVNRALRDMEGDTHRTARNLVDLGRSVAKGPFERQFLDACRRILDDDSSPCFEMLRRVLSCFDRQTLVTFGVNVGFEGCSRGAKRIREAEAREGFNIPWAVRISMGDRGLSIGCVRRVVAEAVDLGIHMFILEDQGLVQRELQGLTEEFPTCAFGLLTEGAGSWEMDGLTTCHNLLLCIDGCGVQAQILCRALEDARIPYAVYLRCDDCLDDLDHRLEAAQELGSPLVVLLGDEAGTETRQQLHRRVLEARSSYTYSFVPMDLPGDLLAIDRIISDDPCSLSLLPDGSVRTVAGICSVDVRSQSLRDILRQVLPKR